MQEHDIFEPQERIYNEAERKALAAFIDPENPNLQHEQFFNQLLDMFMGDGTSELNRHENQVASGIASIFPEIADARRFDQNYLGHMLSESSIPGMLGAILAIRLGDNTVADEVSRTTTALESEAVRGLAKMIGYNPDTCGGTFTSGGSIANMTALSIARKVFQENYKDGIYNGPVRVLTNEMAHHSVNKAIFELGGPSAQIQRVDIGLENWKMSPQKLEEAILQSQEDGVPIMAIVAIAGETETGLVDPLADIAEIAKHYGIFTIADAAYGGPYRISEAGHLFDGLEQFDAVVVDSHKALYVPYEAGAVLVKNPRHHALLTLGSPAEYTNIPEGFEALVAAIESGTASLGAKRLEGSKGAGAILSTLAVLRSLGQEGLETIYNLTLKNIDYLYDRLEASDILEPLHEPELNLLCFTLREEIVNQLGLRDNTQLKQYIDDTRLELDNHLIHPGGYYFSSCNLPLGPKEEIAAYRASPMHPRTTPQILNNAIAELENMIASHL